MNYRIRTAVPADEGKNRELFLEMLRTISDAGVNQAVILYGTDEYRLYEAALAIEQEICSVSGKETVDHIKNYFGQADPGRKSRESYQMN